MAITFNPATKIIQLDSYTASESQIWTAFVDWSVLTDNLKYGVGMIQVGGVVPIALYLYLELGWKIRPIEADGITTITGNILLQDGSSPIAPTVGNWNTLVNMETPVKAVAIGGSSGGGGDCDLREVNTKLDNIKTVVDDTNSDLEPVATGVLTANTKLDSLDTKIVNVDADVAIVDAKLDNLDGDVANVDTKVSAVDTKVSAVDTKVTTLGTSITNLDGDVANIDSDIAAMDTKINTINSNTSGSDQKLTDIKVIVDGTKVDIATLLDVELGNWKIVSNQMIFYKRDGSELKRYNLFDSTGFASQTEVFERRTT